MPGPPPKPPELRQRRNRASTAATLSPAPVIGHLAPVLPKRGPDDRPWHSLTVEFWKEVWSSPMAHEYIPCDVPGLVNVARLQDAVNYGDLDRLPELRLQRQCFGLTPLDRRRLQWESERGETAEKRRKAQQQSGSPLPQPTSKNDPRAALSFVRKA